MTAEENYRLLPEIQANRDFLLLAYRQNPQLLRHAGPEIRRPFGPPAQEQEAEPSRPHIETPPDQLR